MEGGGELKRDRLSLVVSLKRSLCFILYIFRYKWERVVLSHWLHPVTKHKSSADLKIKAIKGLNLNANVADVVCQRDINASIPSFSHPSVK
jgi:hypothetical protein